MIQSRIFTVQRTVHGIAESLSHWSLMGSLVAQMEKAMAPTPVLLPGNSHGWRSLLHRWSRLLSMGSLNVRHDWVTSLSRIGERNGNPIQCSCLENPRDGRAWWAAVYGVAQSRSRLKWLSSSSSWWLRR